MSVEQRLVAALRTAGRVQPSVDLFSRVVHSIEEDRAHRRRVWTSVAITCATAAVLVGVAILGLADGPNGRHIRIPVLQVLQAVELLVLVAVLGPAIRRFGRNYAADLWRDTPQTAAALVRLLDVAYVLVFAGYILLSGDLDMAASGRAVANCGRLDVDCHDQLADQLQYTAIRTGGLFVVMGLLHGVTIMVMPVIALVSNSTRRGRRLPKWLFVLLVLAAVAAGFFVLNVIGALVTIGAGG